MLPYVKISERLRPDDVRSADHMQLLVDTANDADDLLITQHGPGIGARAGLHIGYAPPVHIGTLIASPPPPGEDKPTVHMLAGYIDPASLAWELGEIGPAVPVPTAQYYFSLTTPGDRYLIKAAEVQVSYVGTVGPAAGGAGKSNMFIVRPAIQVGPVSGEIGKSRADVYFGPDYAAVFLPNIVQFTVLLYGVPGGA
jgi:hypothetical protein